MKWRSTVVQRWGREVGIRGGGMEQERLEWASEVHTGVFQADSVGRYSLEKYSINKGLKPHGS